MVVAEFERRLEHWSIQASYRDDEFPTTPQSFALSEVRTCVEQ